MKNPAFVLRYRSMNGGSFHINDKDDQKGANEHEVYPSR